MSEACTFWELLQTLGFSPRDEMRYQRFTWVVWTCVLGPGLRC